MRLNTKNRERFERPDVPSPSPYRNIIAIASLIVIGIFLVVLCLNLWERAQAESNLGVRALSKGLSYQADPVTQEGFKASEDKFENIWILTVDNPAAKTPTLSKIELLSMNLSKNTGNLVSVPLDIAISNGDTITKADEYLNKKGLMSFVAGLSKAANVKADHVILCGDEIWNQIDSLKGLDANSLMNKAGGFLKSIKTDMGATDLLQTLEAAKNIGTANLTKLDCPTEDQTAADGKTTYKAISTKALSESLGLIVAA